MVTLQINEQTGKLFAIVDPATSTPAPPGVEYVHYDEAQEVPAFQSVYDAAWGPKTKEGYRNE